MKTAMQELIERLENSGLNLLSYDYDIFKEALEKEKEHIMMAYNDGFLNAGLKQWKTSTEYYNQTYNQTYNQNK
jgi:hypothetical protein